MNGTQNSRCLGVVTSTVNMTSTEGLFAEEIVHCSLSDENATAYKCTIDTFGYRRMFPSRVADIKTSPRIFANIPLVAMTITGAHRDIGVNAFHFAS